jgi:hypothetical protein
VWICLYKWATDLGGWITDLGGLIGGIFALIAGWLVYRAGVRQARETREGVDRQLAADAKSDRLRAYSIAVGIFPELVSIRGDYEKARDVINGEWPKVVTLGATSIVGRIRDARIPLSPLLNRFTGDLHLLGDAGHSLLQLVSIILQYDGLIDDIALAVERQVDAFNPISLARSLSNHLETIGERLDEAEHKVAAVPPQ